MPKAGQSWGFFTPRMISPLMQAVVSGAEESRRPKRRPASKLAKPGRTPRPLCGMTPRPVGDGFLLVFRNALSLCEATGHLEAATAGRNEKCRERWGPFRLCCRRAAVNTSYRRVIDRY